MKATSNPGCKTVCLLWLVGLAALSMMTSPVLTAGQAEPQGPITFAKDVAPILQRSCQNCHRPDGGAPMSLITYEDVRPYARAIRQKTTRREMPPWYIEKNIGIQRFKNDISLSDEDIATLAKWADGGAPRGNPADTPPPRQFLAADKWAIGTPDLIVSSGTFAVKAKAADWYGPWGSVPTRTTEDRYVKAVEVKEVRPEEKNKEAGAERGAGVLTVFAVHHAQVTSNERNLMAREVVDSDSEGQGAAEDNNNLDYFYELGQNAMIYPDELGVQLKAGSSIYFPNVHLHASGKDTKVRIDVALKFHPKGYTPKYKQAARIATIFGVNSLDLDIPGNQNNVELEGYSVTQKPGKLLTFEPHMHSSGKRMCVTAVYPSGEREILNCSGYNHNWVRAYVYEDDAAPLIPKGTILHIKAWYDNSPTNPRVVDPRNWKGWGQRTITDWFAFLPKWIDLTDEEFKAEVAAREAKLRRTSTN